MAADLDGLIGPTVEGLGYELVGIEYLPQGRHSLLRVYIDHADGITLDDCARVSYQVSGLLDVEDPIKGNYTLEVSSPGLDRPLFKPEHFMRFAGHRVRVRLKVPLLERRKFSGVLQGLRDDQVIVVDDGQEFSLPLDKIEKANLVPEF
jgi:ribosome maturation factor RimP